MVGENKIILSIAKRDREGHVMERDATRELGRILQCDVHDVHMRRMCTPTRPSGSVAQGMHGVPLYHDC